MAGRHAPRSRSVALGVFVLSLMAGSAAGQSPSPSASPGASAPTPSAAPGALPTPVAQVPVGELTWSITSQTRDPSQMSAVGALALLADGRVALVGAQTPDARSQQAQAALWASTDGATWTKGKLKGPKGSLALAVAPLGTGAVVTGIAQDGSGLSWTSADGQAWSKPTPSPGSIYVLAQSGDQVVGAGAGTDGGPAFFSSNDGTTWTSTSLGGSGYSTLLLRRADGGFIAGGIARAADGSSAPAIWTSPDGSTWTPVALGVTSTDRWSAPTAAATPAGYVLAFVHTGADGPQASVWTSADGLTWAETFTDPAGSLSAAAAAGTDVLLVGNGRTVRSSDGVAWTATPEEALAGWTPRAMLALADGRLLAAGDVFDGPTGSRMATWLAQPSGT